MSDGPVASTHNFRCQGIRTLNDSSGARHRSGCKNRRLGRFAFTLLDAYDVAMKLLPAGAPSLRHGDRRRHLSRPRHLNRVCESALRRKLLARLGVSAAIAAVTVAPILTTPTGTKFDDFGQTALNARSGGLLDFKFNESGACLSGRERVARFSAAQETCH